MNTAPPACVSTERDSTDSSAENGIPIKPRFLFILAKSSLMDLFVIHVLCTLCISSQSDIYTSKKKKEFHKLYVLSFPFLFFSAVKDGDVGHIYVFLVQIVSRF